MDLTSHDVYVTEEGMNIPIPTTKALRDKVVNFLETDLEGLKLQTNGALTSLEKLQASIKAAKDQANRAYDKSLNYDGVPKLFVPETTYLNDINVKTVNQLGDLKLNLQTLEDADIDSRLGSLIAEFNAVNQNAMSRFYHNTADANNTYLMGLWAEIQALMGEVNQKLDRLGSFSGALKLKKNGTRTVEAFDCTYSRRLNNFTKWTYIANVDQYVDTTRTSQAKFEAWFRGQAYLDLHRKDMRLGTEWGTGLWYKNFPHKIDLATGTKNARAYETWDLFEVVPLTDYKEYTPGWNINYLRSLSNNIIPDLESRGAYASASNWTTRLTIARWTTDFSRFGYGSDWWRQPVSARGATTATTSDAMMELVSNMKDPYRLQRTPKQTYGHGITSKYAPALATMVREVPYYSFSPYPNTDGIIMRLGLRKTLRETSLDYASYQYDGSKWVRK